MKTSEHRVLLPSWLLSSLHIDLLEPGNPKNCAHVILQHMHLVRSDHRQHEITSQPATDCEKHSLKSTSAKSDTASLLWFKWKVIYWKQFSMQVDAQDSYMCCSVTQGMSVCTSPGCFLVPYFPPAFFPRWLYHSSFLLKKVYFHFSFNGTDRDCA